MLCCVHLYFAVGRDSLILLPVSTCCIGPSGAMFKWRPLSLSLSLSLIFDEWSQTKSQDKIRKEEVVAASVSK